MPAVVAHEYAEVAVADLEEHPENPRRGDVEAIVISIRANGFFAPLVVQRSRNRVLAGNHRLQAARQLGLERLPALVVDVDDTVARRILLADNRAADNADWDTKALYALLQEMSIDTGGLEGSLFDQVDLAKLAEHWAAKGDPDDVPEPPKVALTQPGDLWLLGNHRLLCGDSTSSTDVDRLRAGEKAKLMVTDPPYLVDYDGTNHPNSWNNKGRPSSNKTWDAYKDPSRGEGVAFYNSFLALALAHMEPNAPVYQWHADRRRELVDQSWAKNGLLFHALLVWVKKQAVLTHSDFMWATEFCAYGSAGDYCAYGWGRGHRPDRRRRPPHDQPNVWLSEDSAERAGRHPTEKPVRLWADPYSWHLRSGELAIEPFSGSGTGIAAAEVTGRRCYAMERAPEFVDVACLRWQRTTGKLPVLEASGAEVDFEKPPEASAG